MRVQLIGGFLGAGKTTLIRVLARHLRARGESVAVITNDQGQALVDTHLGSIEAPDGAESTGGCFCCRFDDLMAQWNEQRAKLDEMLGAALDAFNRLVAESGIPPVIP